MGQASIPMEGAIWIRLKKLEKNTWMRCIMAISKGSVLKAVIILTKAQLTFININQVIKAQPS